MITNKPTNDKGGHQEEPSFPAMRTSRSARQSFDAEMTRLRGMSIEERVLEALGMAERYAWLDPAAEGDTR